MHEPAVGRPSGGQCEPPRRIDPRPRDPSDRSQELSGCDRRLRQLARNRSASGRTDGRPLFRAFERPRLRSHRERGPDPHGSAGTSTRGKPAQRRPGAIFARVAPRHTNLFRFPADHLAGTRTGSTTGATASRRHSPEFTAARLELDGRFSEAARLRDALADFNAVTSPDSKSSVLLARAGLAHALAGDFAGAATRIAAAKANAEDRRTAGKPETDTSTLVELLDLVRGSSTPLIRRARMPPGRCSPRVRNG